MESIVFLVGGRKIRKVANLMSFLEYVIVGLFVELDGVNFYEVGVVAFCLSGSRWSVFLEKW